MNVRPDYKFYPSLLDQFQKYLNVDSNLEDFLYLGEDGKWHKNYSEVTDESHFTLEEVEALVKQDLLDSINRVPFESEAADKGTAFNTIVDCYIHGKPHVPDERNNFTITGDKGTNIIQATFPKRYFCFDRTWCIEQAEYFKGAVSQLFVSAMLPTRFGVVELYGFIDELIRDVVYDIKTTSRYEFGKYEHGWQRHVYPYCLIASGQMESVKAFEFTAYALKGGISRTPLISGTQFPEYYTYNHKQSTQMLINHCEAFIQFLEANKELITDKKVFGGQNNE